MAADSNGFSDPYCNLRLALCDTKELAVYMLDQHSPPEAILIQKQGPHLGQGGNGEQVRGRGGGTGQPVEGSSQSARKGAGREREGKEWQGGGE